MQRLRQVPEGAEPIVQATNDYAAHLQLFAEHAWRAAVADAATITLADARSAL